VRWHATKPENEETLARVYRDQASRLYWLAFLITEDRTLSVEAVIEVLDRKDSANPFFEDWMATWAKKLVIAQALGAVHVEMQASMLRIGLCHAERSPAQDRVPLLIWNLDSNAPTLQLERVLLGIDLFPRCALLLLVFEKLSVDDVAILLQADKKLVLEAKAVGLVAFVHNLSRCCV